MADVFANVTFDHAGRQVRVGDVFDDTHELFTLFPSRFTRVPSSFGAASAGGTLGTVVKKVPVTDSGGTVVGYVPVYDDIT